MGTVKAFTVTVSHNNQVYMIELKVFMLMQYIRSNITVCAVFLKVAVCKISDSGNYVLIS